MSESFIPAAPSTLGNASFIDYATPTSFYGRHPLDTPKLAKERKIQQNGHQNHTYRTKHLDPSFQGLVCVTFTCSKTVRDNRRHFNMSSKTS